MVGAGSFRLIGIVLLQWQHQKHLFQEKTVCWDLATVVLVPAGGGRIS